MKIGLIIINTIISFLLSSYHYHIFIIIIIDYSMAALEERPLSDAPYKPLLWWRFIDDIFLIWQHGEEKL